MSKSKIRVCLLEDSAWKSGAQRCFCRSRRALQNTLLIQLASTFPKKVIRKMKFVFKIKNWIFSTFLNLKFESEDWDWEMVPEAKLFTTSSSTKWLLDHLSISYHCWDTRAQSCVYNFIFTMNFTQQKFLWWF